MKFLLCLGLLLSIQDVMAATSPLCPGQEGYYYTNYRRRNPQQGGFVANTAYVADNDVLFLAPTAAVCDSAQVYDSPRILGHAVVKGNAEVFGSAALKGNVIIDGDSRVSGNARIQDQVRVTNSSISGDAVLKGWFKANDTSISSGEHFAPEFSEEYFAAQRAAEQRRLEAIAKSENLRSELSVILDSKLAMIAEKGSDETSLFMKLAGKAVVSEAGDPCTLTILSGTWNSALTMSDPSRKLDTHATINLRKTKKFTKGFSHLWETLMHGAHVYDKSDFLKEVKRINPSFAYKKEMTFGPSLMISSGDYQFDLSSTRIYNSDLERAGISEKLFVSKRDSNIHSILLFSSVSQRDEFTEALKRLYNSCPSAP